MGLRRMLSKNIISSAKFIKMPPSTQMLYFHLVLNADDDGIVESFTIIKMVGASEDDLKVLIAKNFITILNDDLVAWINDWFEHNYIRADRKTDSKYKDLLLEIVKDIKLIEPKPRSDRQILGQSHDSPMDSPRTDNGRHKISKDNINKDNKEKEINKEKEKSLFENFPYLQQEEFKKSFDDFLEMRVKIKKPATYRSKELILKKLHAQQYHTAIEMLEQSVEGSYQGVFPVRQNKEVNYANNKVSKQQFKPGSIAAAWQFNREIEAWAASGNSENS